MNKLFTIYIYGAIVILEGILLLLSEFITLKFINLITGIAFIVGAFFAFIAAFSQEKKQVQFVYHSIHTLAMLVFGIAILMYSITIERFIAFTMFLFIFYSVSEIIFCNWLFNLNQKAIYKTIIIRFLLGLIIGFGSIVVMNFSKFRLEGFGVLFILVGANIVLYAPAMKGKEVSKS